jgi:hypothetical protein
VPRPYHVPCQWFTQSVRWTPAPQPDHEILFSPGATLTGSSASPCKPSVQDYRLMRPHDQPATTAIRTKRIMVALQGVRRDPGRGRRHSTCDIAIRQRRPRLSAGGERVNIAPQWSVHHSMRQRWGMQHGHRASNGGSRSNHGIRMCLYQPRRDGHGGHIPSDYVVTPRCSHNSLDLSIHCPHDVSSELIAI